jgi:hypothetical protein
MAAFVQDHQAAFGNEAAHLNTMLQGGEAIFTTVFEVTSYHTMLACVAAHGGDAVALGSGAPPLAGH